MQRIPPVWSKGASFAAVLHGVRAGNPQAAADLYWRSRERLLARLTALLGPGEAAGIAVASAFGGVLDRLDATPEVVDFDALLDEAARVAAATVQRAAA